MRVQSVTLLYFLSMVALPATASPLRSNIVARDESSSWPNSAGPTYFGLVIIAIIVPVIIFALIISAYRRKHGHYPSFRRKPVINGTAPTNPAAPWARRRAVWRPGDAEEGLPGYTMEAKEGELSLGIGRKRGSEEENELAEALERSISEQTRESRTESTMTTGENTEVTTPKRTEELPPYIPPPAPAVLVKNGYIFGRIGSRQSVASAPRRTSLLSSSRRSSGAE